MGMVAAGEEMVTAEDHAAGKILLIFEPKRRSRETGSAFFITVTSLNFDITSFCYLHLL